MIFSVNICPTVCCVGKRVVCQYDSVTQEHYCINLQFRIVELDKLDINSPTVPSCLTQQAAREPRDGPREDPVRETTTGGQQEKVVSAELQGES